METAILTAIRNEIIRRADMTCDDAVNKRLLAAAAAIETTIDLLDETAIELLYQTGIDMCK